MALSLAGDGAVPAALWLSWTHPLAFFVALALALVVMVAAIVLFAKFLRVLARRLTGRRAPAAADADGAAMNRSR